MLNLGIAYPKLMILGFQDGFNLNEGPFHSADRLYTGNFAKLWYTETSFSDCSGLVEVAAHKAEHYPNLESTVTSELDSVKGARESLRCRCLPRQCSTEISNVSGTRAISLIGSLRALKGWPETYEEVEMLG